jgi:uncharacterized protein
MQLQKAENFIVELLESQLPSTLHYHQFSHTRNVVKASLDLAKKENITDPKELMLLKTAALYHDSGFLHVYNNHEEEGCRISKEVLPGFGYSEADIDEICAMIMKTKIPQQPVTHLEKILCDADLYHLGGVEFDEVGAKLYQERLAYGFVHNEHEWNLIQISFLESHHYWTESAKSAGDQKKLEHLNRLKNLVGI